MLRAVSTVYLESQALELCLSRRLRRDVFKLFRTQQLWTSAPTAAAQTVLNSSTLEGGGGGSSAGPGSGRGAPPPPPPPPPPPRPTRAWTITAAALALTASVGGVYFYRKLNEEEERGGAGPPSSEAAPPAAAEPPAAAYPASGADFPKHVQYLLIGGGTASFAAMRAIRSARPDASVLIVGEEPHPPYMRPPLSKELWREPELGRAAADDALAHLSFRQWNGKRRPLTYEPLAFYTPVERLAADGGAGVARGWRVARLDLARHEAELRAPGAAPVTLTYERALLAPGARPRRLPELRAARDAGLALAVRGAGDAARLARALDDPARPVRRVLVVGGGFLASELSAALAERLGGGARVVQVYREEAPLAHVLPPYLAAEAARRLRAAGVELVAGGTVEGAAVVDGGAGVELRLGGGAALRGELVVECVGAEPATEVARAAGLEEHPALGGLVVNAELQAATDVWAAGDAACFYDAALGRRRVEHHDHAVVSGRLAGENMAGVAPPKRYSHQSMFWSDLGPSLGYEAIGVVDSRLPTLGVFSAAAVTTAGAEAGAEAAADGAAPAPAPAPDPQGGAEPERRFERGVVFYTREKRVVGVLLWNLFNRMHIARQVLAQGEFDDLFEVAKLFALHEED